MRAHKKQIVFGIVAFLTICSYILATHHMQRLEEYTQILSFVNVGEAGFPMSETEDNRCTFWSEYAGMTVENTALSRVTDASVLALHGRSDLLFSDAPVLDAQSNNSCLISSSLAYELFGDTNVEGLSIKYQEASYEIVGVIDHKEKLFVYEPLKENIVSLHRVAFDISGENSVKMQEESLQMKYGNGNVIDYTLIMFTLESFLLGIPVLMAILLLKLVWNEARGSGARIERYIWFGVFFIVGVIVLFCCLKQIQIPADMIPERWSNFEFWTDYMKEQKDNFNRLSTIQKTILDTRISSEIKRVIGYNILALSGVIYNLFGTKMVRLEQSD